MKTKDIKHLHTKKDAELFEECEEGLALCASNAERLCAGWQALSRAGHRNVAEILRFAAEEEAAKTTILLDAIRCPRANDDQRLRQFDYFNDHLAKVFTPTTFGPNQTDLAG